MPVDAVVLAGMLVVVGVVGALVLRARYTRRAAGLAAWATGRGWAYTESDPSLAKRYTHHPFKSSGAYAHVIRGDHHGRSFTAFEHYYGEPSAGPPIAHTYQAVAVAILDAGDLPQSSLAELFNADPRARKWSARLADGELLGWAERSLDPEGCMSMLDYLVDVAKRLPSR